MKKMYTLKGIAVLGLALSTMVSNAQSVESVKAGESACGVKVEKATMQHSDNQMNVGLSLNLDDLKVKANRAAVFTPVIVNGADSLALSPIGVYGYMRKIQAERAGEMPYGGSKETSYKYGKRPSTYEYNETVPYAGWMKGSKLLLKRCDYGCKGNLIGVAAAPVAAYGEEVKPQPQEPKFAFAPAFHYARPVAEADKTSELSGSANIDFPLNGTEIKSDYSNNAAELAKIKSIIDSISGDKDVTVSSISFKGYSSPDGPYAGNARFAKARTEALKKYVNGIYKFDDSFITTSSEAEDWAGLRAYVAGSNLEHRSEILDIIDSNLTPDEKNTKIFKTYPEDYKFLLHQVYPSLRRSEYSIVYSVRGFSDVKEIAENYASNPKKLSLNEMFLLAQNYEAGSDKYNEIFATAVSVYPENETANLNAANAAMSCGDLAKAEKYLAKAGNSAEATYARGVYAALTGKYAQAADSFKAVSGQIPEAASALNQLGAVLK